MGADSPSQDLAVRSAEWPEQLAVQHRAEVDGLGGAVIKHHAERVGGDEVERLDAADPMAHDVLL